MKNKNKRKAKMGGVLVVEGGRGKLLFEQNAHFPSPPFSSLFLSLSLAFACKPLNRGARESSKKTRKKKENEKSCCWEIIWVKKSKRGTPNKGLRSFSVSKPSGACALRSAGPRTAP